MHEHHDQQHSTVQLSSAKQSTAQKPPGNQLVQLQYFRLLALTTSQSIMDQFPVCNLMTALPYTKRDFSMGHTHKVYAYLLSFFIYVVSA